MAKTVSMDLGTTNSCVAFDDGRKADVIEQADGTLLLPSVVAFQTDPELDVIAGKPAISEGRRNPDFCFRHVKRLLGLKWHGQEDTGSQTAEKDGMTYLIGPPRPDDPADNRWAPKELQAVIIKTLLDAAETYFNGERPAEAVITVPADFDDAARRETMEAAELAGIKARLLKEPEAAAIAEGAGKEKFTRPVVYDFGGGTFDISVVKVGGERIDVVASNGNRNLGGTDFTNRIVKEMVRRFREAHDLDLTPIRGALPRLWEAAEEAKIKLSTDDRATIHVPSIVSKDGAGFIDLRETLTRKELEELVGDLVQKTLDCCTRALKAAGVTVEDIDEVILVGGQTRMPMVREQVEKFFGRKPRGGVSPEKVVAIGAAMFAAQLDGRGGNNKFKLTNRSPHSLGIEAEDDVCHVVIPKGTPLPADKPLTRRVVLTNRRANIDALSVHIVQGEEPEASRNTLLASDFIPIDRCEEDEASVELLCSIDVNGLARVTHGERILYEGAPVE